MKETVMVRIPKDIRKRLKIKAAQKGKPMSELAKEALEDYLQKSKDKINTLEI